MKQSQNSFLIVFDIPRDIPLLALRVNRMLKRINAQKFQHSIWKSEKLNELIAIATFIKQHGGKASILEEKFVF
ncbi:MAG: hypothetical protein J7K98_03815 [Candidatus Aenigmarchaeota archaeon]|nr:hypothetical protein [Candidatus Aenigmarchaeota archaeon]